MNVSTPSGRCGPCCSTAATGRMAIQRPVSPAAKSCQVISSQLRFGSIGPRGSCNRSPCPGAAGCGGGSAWARPCAFLILRRRNAEKPMILIRLLRGVAVCLALAAPAAGAQPLDKVTLGTNWVAEAEHGGFYQAVADGTYRKYGLDVTIVQGGPQVNNRLLLTAGRMDFVMIAGTLQAFDAAAQRIPTVSVAAMFQKDPQVLLAHPDRGIE